MDWEMSKHTQDSSPDWQITKNSITEKYQFIFNSEVYSDVHFIVGEKKQRIPAHKLVLSVGSPVFGTMFNSNWDSNEVEVPDIEPAAFLSLLKFLYYDHVEVSMENALSVIYAAKKYIIPILEDHCLSYIQKSLNASNAFTLLIQAKQHKDEKFKLSSLEIIDVETAKAVLSPEFCDIDHDLLCSILRRDSLTIKECDLFQAVLRWCNAECKRKQLAFSSENRRSVLKEALYLLRFPLMSVEEFTSFVADTGLLSDTEQLQTLLFLVDKKKSVSAFSTVPRQTPYLIAKRYSALSNNHYECQGDYERIGFSVNCELTLVGIGIYGPDQDAGSFDVLFTLRGQNRSSIISSFEKEVISPLVNASKTFHLLLESPVKIKPNIKYSIGFAIQGPNTLCGCNVINKFSTKRPNSNVEVKVIFWNFDSYDDDYTFDQFADEDIDEYIDKYSHISHSGQLPELLFSV